MLKKFLLLVLLSIPVHAAFAQQQEDNAKPYQLSYDSWWTGRFRLLDDNGLIIRKKVKDQEMKSLLAEYPQGLNTYTQYLKGKKTGKILAYTGGGIALVGVGLMLASLDYSPYATNTIKNKPVFWTGWGCIATGATLYIINIPVSISTASKAKRLTKAYNDYTTKKYSLQIGLKNNELGLALKF